MSVDFDDQERSSLLSNYCANDDLHQEISGNENELAQQYRSQSHIKWLICISMSFSLLSAYFNVFGPSYLEDSLISHFGWSSSDYSYMFSFTFIAAIFAPVFIPSLLRNFAALSALIIVQIPIIIGQIIFVVAIVSPLHSYYSWILYLSRILIGIGVGGCGSLVIAVLIFWFGEGKDIALASCTIVFGIESGVLIGRYSMTSLEEMVGLGYAYIFGIIVAVFSILLLMFAREFEKRWLATPDIPAYVVKHSRILQKLDEQSSGTTWQLFCRAVKSFEIEVWLVIAGFSLVYGVTDTVYSTFTSPLMYMYDVSEYSADKLLGMITIAIVATALFSGYIMDRVGFFVQFNLLSVLLIFIGLLLLYFGDNWFNAVLAVSIISVGNIFASAIFSLKAMIAPVEHASFVASISTSLYWIFSCILTDSVGWMKDEYGSYSYSVLLIAIVSFVNVVIGFLIYLVSVIKGIDFHRSRWNTNENKLNKNVDKEDCSEDMPSI